MRCKAITRSGSPCRSYAILGSEYCFTHDPAKASERAAAHYKGGKARQAQRRYKKLWNTEESIHKILPHRPDGRAILPKKIPMSPKTFKTKEDFILESMKD